MESNPKENTLHCKKCGVEIPKDADYCPACGESTNHTGIKYIKPQRGRWGAGQTVAVIIGSFMILVSMPILIGGGALLGFTDVMSQGDGYIGIENIGLTTTTQALVARDMDIEDIDFDDDGPPGWLWASNLEDFITLKIKAENNDGKQVFVGIIEEQEALDYLGSAAYTQVTHLDMEDHPSRPDIDYLYHAGQEITELPTNLDIWVEEAHGYGEQTLTWSPRVGRYWLVVMNADASTDIDVNVGAAVKAPFLGNIGRGLFASGIIILALGVVVIYFGAIKPRQ